jgi:hypothetical protein
MGRTTTGGLGLEFSSQLGRLKRMAVNTHDFYRSSNGDRWQLLRDSETGRQIVRHEPNLASGGQVAEIDVEVFLARAGTSPENLALRALLEKL